MRNPVNVAKKIQEVFPESEKFRMNWYIKDFEKRPKELWQKCHFVLQGVLLRITTDNPTEDWHWQAWSALIGKSVEEVKKAHAEDEGELI